MTKKRKETAPIIDLTPAVPGKEDKALFEALRTLRWEIAKEESRAPYLIMGDKTLHELATTKPTSLLAFGNTFGIGQHKCETYGERFLAVIKDYPTTAAAPTDEEEQAAISPEEVIFDLVDSQSSNNQIISIQKISSAKRQQGITYMDQQKLIHQNAYAKWTKEDDHRLQQLYEDGVSVKELMELFSRNRGSIISRLKKLGLR